MYVRDVSKENSKEDHSPQAIARPPTFCSWFTPTYLVCMMPMNSLGGYLYYITFRDDYSRKTWLYFLKKKDEEVFSWFHHFKALIENQTDMRIKILRTDNGTEYESNGFHDFCTEVGIKRETIMPYTLEQNGVSERKNRTILEVVHSMLYDQRLPKFLWAEAVNTAVYVQH